MPIVPSKKWVCRYLLIWWIIIGFFPLGMGIWQWQRYLYKKNMEKLAVLRSNLPAIDLNLLPSQENLLYRRVQLSGHLVSNGTFLLDNRVVNKKLGYQVYSVMQIDNGDLIIVDRGWVLASINRAILPVISENISYSFLQGYLWRPAGDAFLLNRHLWAEQGWPARIQSVDIDRMSNLYGKKLYPWIVILDADQVGVFLQAKLAYRKITAVRHLGYAVQWWLIAITWWLLYFWRKKTEKSTNIG